MKIEYDTPGSTTFHVNELQIDAFYHMRSGSDRIVFLGQSALSKENREKGLPFYFRNSWVEEIECSTVIFNDPTLYVYSALFGEWSQGLPDNFGITAMASVCEDFIAFDGKQRDFGFYGSSAGGFWALMMAGYFERPCVVETPQTDMLLYPLEEAKELLLNFWYRNHGLNPHDFKHRLSVVDWYEHIGKRPSKIDYFQSSKDTGHVETQMKPFFSRIGPCANVQKTFYDREPGKSAHGPMNKRSSLAVINNML